MLGAGLDEIELAGCGYSADTDMPRSAWGSCGRPFPGMQVRIVDPDNGVPVAAETVGMIQIRGPRTMRGMCGRSREEPLHRRRLLPTGDLVHLDNDDAVPRGSMGKVDVRRLRDMLADTSGFTDADR